MGNLTNRKRKRMAKKAGEASAEMAQEFLQSRIGMSKKEIKPTEIRTRTRTRVRAGGNVVKTKTVSKGDGMKRVERTKTKNDAFGPYTQKSIMEKGPMGKRSMVSWSGSYPEGDGYSFNLQRSKIGGRKTKMETMSDIDGSQSKYKEKGKGYKAKTVKVTEPGGRSYIKKKGRGSRMQLMSKPIKKSM